MGHYDPQRADNDVGFVNRPDNGVFTGCPAVCPGFQHLCRGDCIGPQGANLNRLAKCSPELFDNGASNASSLPVYYTNTHQDTEHSFKYPDIARS